MPRASSLFLDLAIDAEPTKVLDHGFVRVVDYMGDESAIVRAARVSYGPGTKTLSDDRSLICYLMRHRHTSPLEMCEIALHVKLPIFVARQWIRHRTANVNEISARYSILDREFYVPAAGDVAAQSKSNKQGRGEVADAEGAEMIRGLFRAHGDASYDLYERMLRGTDEELPSVARELARCNLTLGHYTQWYWKIDLHNLLHFLGLRLDQHAQLEIRRYAEVVWGLVRGWVPKVAEAFEDYQMEAVTFSRQERAILARMIDEGKLLDDGASAHVNRLSRREYDEFLRKIQKTKEGLS